VSALVNAVIFDLGGVLTESPMHAFAAYEAKAVLPDGLIRRLNSTDPDTNAWARYERNELDVAGFTAAFEAEALAAGHRVEAARVLEALRGDLRPEMVAAVHRLKEAGLPLGLLSNNVAPMERTGDLGELLTVFDAIVESSVEGVRKPEPEIYTRALERLSAAVGRPLAAPDDASAPKPNPGRSPRRRGRWRRLGGGFVSHVNDFLDTLTLIGPQRWSAAGGGQRLELRLESVVYRVLLACALIGLANSNPTLRQLVDALV
jgi:putative hydrolase of the HAD superfamily